MKKDLLPILFSVIANPYRLAILQVLEDGEQTVGHITSEAGFLQAIVSQHLKVLRDHNIVTARREGIRAYYRTVAPEVLQIFACLRKCGLLDPTESTRPGRR